MGTAKGFSRLAGLTTWNGRVARSARFWDANTHIGGILNLKVTMLRSRLGFALRIPKKFTFSVVLPILFLTSDVNGSYISHHSLLDEIRQSISNFISRNLELGPAQDFPSAILILRIDAPAQPLLSLSRTINQLLSGSEEKPPLPKIVIEDIPQVETKIRSARGIEYMKPTMRKRKEFDMVVGSETPGVDYYQTVSRQV